MGAAECYLGMGEFQFASGPLRLRTLLGSCVAIVLWHPERGIGGMCHYMLPSRQPPLGAPPDGRYGDEAMMLFDQAIARYRSQAADYRAQVFGGGNMFPRQQAEGSTLDIGRRNIDTAHRLLAERGIPIVAEHLGGYGHRKLVFDVHSGKVWLLFQEENKPYPRRPQ
ncbi:chemotaxis protein CheD [Azoarcus sp. TTM-91]|uniref:chemotaxis protein CheD n=1 Tax=Azoarcus sp. TTM-91 TaxID=2691581 RepID=UPI00145E7D92|nr:chemotaxis protein CheD [Azoarcus sp. TTM-91]NMG36181.1 chemotaxis protein CheD [Azoarcus sp. TTM-91]